MSYTRCGESGHYIWCGADFVDFNGFAIPDDEIDVFIYKLYSLRSKGEDKEFWDRFHHGKRVIDNFQKGFSIKKHHKHSEELEVPAAAIAALADEIWREHYTPIIGAAQVDYMLETLQSAGQIYEDIKNHDYIYFTAEDDESQNPVSYAAVQPKEDHLFLSKLYVRKDYRGKGAARSFLEEAAALCRWEYGFDKIRVMVAKQNTDSIAAYEKMGFVNTGPIKTDIGGGFFMDDYLMELIIQDSGENNE